MTKSEIDTLQMGIFENEIIVGGIAFNVGQNEEIHPRPERMDFSKPTQLLISRMGFRRAIDTTRGPFYYRRRTTAE